MKKILWTTLLGLPLVVASSAGALAKPTFHPAQVLNPVTGEPQKTVTIPERAIEVAPNLFYLGTAVDNGRIVEGFAIVDHKMGFGKPGTECGNNICEPGENAKKCPADCASGEEPGAGSCYGFLAKGAKWKTVESYLIDPANDEGLDYSFIRSNLVLDINKWEDAADGNQDGITTKDILGNETSGLVDGADTVSPDGKNEVYFGDIEGSSAIGVTIIWGTFRGPPSGRELIEWDQVYDQTDFDWSPTGEMGKMDFENIATHELGHSVGLDDLYTSGCSEETMYGYATEGETKKRTLEAGDIAGVADLYQ